MNRVLNRLLGGALCSALALGLALTGGPAAAQTAPRTLRISVSTAADHPLTVGAQKFADLVTAKSGEKFKVRVYPGATLGSDVQVIASLQGGTIDATVVTTGLLTSLIKEYNLFILPGVLQSVQEADAVLDGPFGSKLRTGLEVHRLIGLAYMEHGFKHVTNNKRPISKWEDIEGLKIRVTQTPSLIDVFKRLGANPVPMAFNEVYTALETGATDGLETTLATFEATKLYEVQKHVALTSHIYDPLILLFSKPVWDKMQPEERKLLTDSATEASAYQRQFNRDREAKLLGDLKKRGIAVTDVSSQEKVRMRERLKTVVDTYSQAVGEPSTREFLAEIEKSRAKR
jgi:tripartite ATP-independent transporter DctP family solute receptor